MFEKFIIDMNSILLRHFANWYEGREGTDGEGHMHRSEAGVIIQSAKRKSSAFKRMPHGSSAFAACSRHWRLGSFLKSGQGFFVYDTHSCQPFARWLQDLQACKILTTWCKISFVQEHGGSVSMCAWIDPMKRAVPRH